YAYAEMASRAMERAKDCINMEGMHLVEHLLLRPEKGGTKAIPICETSGNTGLPFQPGADGYSFIATAFLPAWPERFRKKENRQVLETLLQEETPAHILLRILWLTPEDMCRREGMYKDWLRWLIPEKPCGDFKMEEWVRLLFEESPRCLANCAACTVASETAGSGSAIARSVDGDEWLSEINLLYCWKDMACADTSKWKFDTPVTNPKPGGIQFTVTPKPVVTVKKPANTLVGKQGPGNNPRTRPVKADDPPRLAADRVKVAADKVPHPSGIQAEAERIVVDEPPVRPGAIPETSWWRSFLRRLFG
ncbi:MAG TPA: hypothetical protein VKQ52_15190, partial [Puia sp.]|nr:hypothetical protein [Puia sp.]